MGKVYGIHFEDEATSVLARRVMSVSCAMACLALVSGVLQLISYSYYSIGVFAAVVIPCCGYCGAKHRSRMLLRFFTWCNLLLVIFFIVSFAVSRSRIGDYYTCACSASCSERNNIPPDVAQHACESASGHRLMYWIAMGFAFGMVALQLCGFAEGHRLLKATHFETHSSALDGIPVIGTRATAAQSGLTTSLL